MTLVFEMSLSKLEAALDLTLYTSTYPSDFIGGQSLPLRNFLVPAGLPCLITLHNKALGGISSFILGKLFVQEKKGQEMGGR